MPDSPSLRVRPRRWMLIAGIVVISSVAVFVGMMLRLERTPHSVEAPVSGALPSGLLSIGSHQMIVELAMTNASREQGLSDRRLLANNHGMLFVFDKPEIQTFWMHRMQFPLDMIFLREGTVVDIHENIPPPSETNGVPQVVASRTEADQVLEINAGQVAALGIQPGDTVELYRD